MALAILAAGQSQRFGVQDKLASILGGKILGLHVAEALTGLPFDQKSIVTVSDHPCSDHWSDLGYDLLINDDAENGQATSVKMAARFAQEIEAGSLCICLADMPFVTSGHITQLIAEFQRYSGARIVASSQGEKVMPPAIFPETEFGKLLVLRGDKGARDLMIEAKRIDADEPILMDIDSKNDLRSAEQILAK